MENGLNNEKITAILAKDKGSEANLQCWEVKDLEEKGYNYTCAVKIINVSYVMGNQQLQTSYFFKFKDSSAIDPLTKNMISYVFKKESFFYFEFLPKLNIILAKCNQKELNVPNALGFNLELGKEFLILKNLKSCGFKPFDRLKYLDVGHTTLILQEFARLHATSIILHYQQHNEDWLSKFPQLDNPFEACEGLRVFYNTFFGFTEGVADVASEMDSFKNASDWIINLLSNIYERWVQDLNQNFQFLAACHGDGWVNNLMFK